MSWLSFHEQSERFASEAETAVRAGKPDLARNYYSQAAQLEESALGEVDPTQRRTKGITAVSAASLWFKAKAYDNAERVATQFLADNGMPEFARNGLTRLVRAIAKIKEAEPERPAHNEGYIALVVSEHVRQQLLAIVPPRYPVFEGNHITLALEIKWPSDNAAALMTVAKKSLIKIYGMADDQKSVQAFLVRVNGYEKDITGRPYHLTWSIDPNVEVPAAYTDNDKPDITRSRHAKYVSGQGEFITRWPSEKAVELTLSPRFYLYGQAEPVAVSELKL